MISRRCLNIQAPHQQNKPNAKPVQGLLNKGNTCFVNSALQALASFDLFYDYLAVSRSNSKCKVASTLLSDLCALKNPTEHSISVKLNSVPVVEEYFICSMEQQDSSEFLTFLMEWVDSEIRDALEVLNKPDLFSLKRNNDVHRQFIGETDASIFTKEGGAFVCTRKRSPFKKPEEKKENTHPRSSTHPSTNDTISHDESNSSRKLLTLFQPTGQPNPFSGIIKSSLTCPHSSHQSDSYSNFLHLSVPIPQFKEGVSLENCFQEFTKQEDVEYDCEVCQTQNKSTDSIGYITNKMPIKYAKKQLSIAHPPKILCIHFQRLVTHQNTFYGSFGTTKVDTLVQYGLKFNISPFCSSSFHGENPPKIINYDLRAIIVHTGGPYEGHYVTYKRNHNDTSSSWVYISDNKWQEVTEEQALNLQAFMLFYSLSE